MLRVLNIAEGTSVDGPGLRTSIYFAGCNHHCEGCHNPQSWDRNGGKEWSVDELMHVINYNDFPVTFTGGDPLLQIDELIVLARRIKEELGKNIWCYTGYLWEDVIQNPKFMKLLPYIDVMVEGPFIFAQRDITLLFKGSANQRLVNVQESLKQNKTIEYV